MRKNQISIKIERFVDLPDDSLCCDHQIIEVYADSNNPYEALAAAYNKAICELEKGKDSEIWGIKNGGEYRDISLEYDKAIQETRQNRRLPEFGCVESNTDYTQRMR